jgi:hypothetical protein
MSARFKKKTTSDAAGDIWPDDRLERCVLNTPSRRSCRRRDRPPSSDASQNAGACCRRARLFCRRGSIPSGHRPPSESSRVENLRKLLRHPRHQSLAGIGGGGGRSHALKTADTGVFIKTTRAHGAPRSVVDLVGCELLTCLTLHSYCNFILNGSVGIRIQIQIRIH